MIDASFETIDKQSISKIFDYQKKKSLELRTGTHHDRANKLRRIHRWMETNREKIQQAVSADLGKHRYESDITEVQIVSQEIKHTLRNLHRWVRPQKVEPTIMMLGAKGEIIYEPKGVCLIIAPWNFPFNLCIGPLIHAIAAGNTAILKPSELTPNTSHLVSGMIQDLFRPNEVAVIEGGPDIARKLLEFPFDHIFFTGSTATGKNVMKAAANHLCSVTLELGGKSPAIVDDTCDIKEAAFKIAWSKFINNGQTCIAPDFIFLHKGIRDEFVNELKLKTHQLFDKENEGYINSEHYSRIINENHHQRLQSLVRDAIGKGGDIIWGGNTNDEKRFYGPAIIENVRWDMDIMQEEIFGPVLPIVYWEGMDEVIRTINNHPKPLAIYLFTGRKKSIQQITNQTSSGTICINDCVIQFAHNELPFGGIGNSGFGKSHGFYGFRAFSNEKSYLKQKAGKSIIQLIYPPYRAGVKKILDFLLKYL